MWALRLRHSIRSLARDSAFVLSILMVLSLGIAASTTIFTMVDQVVLNPLPYKDPARLLMIWEANPSIGEPAGSRVAAAWKNFTEWQRQAQSFEFIEAYDQIGFNLTGLGSPEHLLAARATSGYFQMLGVDARLGHTFSPADCAPGADPVVLITEAFAASHFGQSDPIGRKLLLNNSPYTIVGVLPRSFHLNLLFQGSYEYKPEIWVPLPPVTSADPGAAKIHQLLVSGRLKSNVTLAQARAELNAVAQRLAQSDPSLNSGYGVNLVPLKVENADPDLRRALYVLWGAALILLLLGCLNLASLMTVRVMNKRKDLTIMGALGAPKRVLIGMVVTESLILAFIAAFLALLGSYGGIALVRSLQPGDITGAERLHLDSHSILSAAVTFALSILIFGFLPAWINSRRSFGAVLRSSSRAGDGRFGTQMRRILVGTEIAITLVLAISATLLIRSFQRLLEVDPGYRAHNVITARISLAPPRYANADDRRHFCDRLLNRVRQLPSVESVSLTDSFPLYSIYYTSFEIEGRPITDPGQAPTADYADVTPDYFQTLGTPLIKGRYFTPDEMHGDASNVAILNESLERKYWPSQNPIGAHIRMLYPNRPPGPWRLVVGVVRDYRQFNIETPARTQMFWPADNFRSMTIVVKTATGSGALLPALQRAVVEIDKDQPLADVQTLQHMVDHSISQRRFNMMVLAGFSALGIVLALVGVYGLISYIVSSHLRDIGIRLTLGAQQWDVFYSLVAQIVPFAAAGLFGGLLLSFFTKSMIEHLLFETSAIDPATYLILPLILMVVATLACVLPALRAARIDPVAILRQE